LRASKSISTRRRLFVAIAMIMLAILGKLGPTGVELPFHPITVVAKSPNADTLA
jgi:hypothetical protein